MLKLFLLTPSITGGFVLPIRRTKKAAFLFSRIGIEKRRVCVVFSFHLFFLNAVCWWLGLQGFGRHIKALSLKSSKLVVNSA